jgi:hypothetical protein
VSRPKRATRARRRATASLRAFLIAALLAAGWAQAESPSVPERRPSAQRGTITVQAAPAAILPSQGRAEVAALSLTADDPDFGGLSALWVSPDGARALLVGDRGALYEARLRRAQGALTGLESVRRIALTPPAGHVGAIDLEGLAVPPDGVPVVSLEGPSRLWRLEAGAAAPIAGPAAFDALQSNSGLEALASGPDGALYVIPERSGALDRAFPIWRRSPGGGWETGTWPRRPPFLPTGADIGPDGALYVVERDFRMLGGFAWRLSRASLSDWPYFRPVTLVQVDGGLDNIEGVSIWRDAEGGLRAVMIADDNFNILQRTLLVEAILTDREPDPAIAIGRDEAAPASR